MDPSYLSPGRFVDSDHPDVVAFARGVCEGAADDRERATRLFAAVRERILYDPYTLTVDPEEYKASSILGRDRAYCIPKAVLLCAAARAAGIPARLGFADVKNHLASQKLLAMLRTDLFAWHGYVELWIDGRPFKAVPAFNAALCTRFGVPPLEFDGTADAMLQAFDTQGRRYMEYLKDRGMYLDLPYEEIFATFRAIYGKVRPPEHDDAFER